MSNMLPSTTHDEQARQDFARAFRRYLKTDVMPGNRRVFKERVEPAFRSEKGRTFTDYHEIRGAMTRDPYYQFWSAMQRRSQELMWDAVIDSVERERDALVERFVNAAAENPAGGSLRLNPNCAIPRYHTALDIHLQPGGYHTDFGENDVCAGALYQAGLPIYIDGELGPECDGIGRALLNLVAQKFAGVNTRRILDMGCATGNSTLPWAREFGEAEVYGIDVGGPCLRYGHARAELLGVPVHFSQQNAEKTDFTDESFDMVISHIMLHETSKPALRNIVAESFRLLRPGGVMLHLDVPRGDDAYQQFMSQWETYNNNEVFSAYMTDVDLPALAAAVGFGDGKTYMTGAAPADGGVKHAYNPSGFEWPVLVGVK